MSYLTFDYLDEQRSIIKKAFDSRTLFEDVEYSTNKIFLSHRHKDIAYVEEAVGFLESQGANIYVDYLDDVLPNKTSSETAEILRSRIDSCSKFILLATPNSLESRWIPWELGLGDKKGINNVAILPLLEQENYWKEREYYQIYGRIEESKQGNWSFFSPDKPKGTKLNFWLQKKRTFLLE